MPSTLGLYLGEGPEPGHDLLDDRGYRVWTTHRADLRQAARPRKHRAGSAGRSSVRQDVGGHRCPERPHPVPVLR